VRSLLWVTVLACFLFGTFVGCTSQPGGVTDGKQVDKDTKPGQAPKPPTIPPPPPKGGKPAGG